ncbi:MAG: metalloprotease [Myxococcota bacterium]
MLETGYLTLFRVKQVPVRVHWSAPLAAFILGEFRFAPGFWLGFFLIFIAHELGHAVLVWRRGLAVLEMRVTGLGGVCIHAPGSHEDAVIISWGGVLAQLGLYALAQGYVLAAGPSTSAFAFELLHALTRWNLIIAALNLIPVEPFDGALAWELPKRWMRRGRASKPGKPQRQAKRARRKAGAPAEVVPLDAEKRAKKLAQDALDAARKR